MSTIRVTVEVPELTSEEIAVLRSVRDPTISTSDTNDNRRRVWDCLEANLLIRHGAVTRLGRAVLAHYEERDGD